MYGTSLSLNKQISVCFATFNRPYCAQRLISSIRKHLGGVEILVADQSRRSFLLEKFYDENDVQVVWMPHDSGVTASRNAIVSLLRTPYFVLCDDDFVILEDNNISESLEIMSLKSNLGILGGRLKDVWKGQEYDRYWEHFLNLDARNRSLFINSIYEFGPISVLAGQYRYFKCDAVMNWFIARTAIFSDKIRWDERFKSNGEHEDFFLNFKINSSYDVGYYPAMKVRHDPPSTRKYATLRLRTGGWLKFMDKWDIDQMSEVGVFTRTRANPGQDLVGKVTRASFFLSADLRRNRLHNLKEGALEIDALGRSGVIGANIFDEAGERNGEAPTFFNIYHVEPGTIVGRQTKSSARNNAAGRVPPFPKPTADSPSYFAIPNLVTHSEDFVVWHNGCCESKVFTAVWYSEVGDWLGATEFSADFGHPTSWVSTKVPIPEFDNSHVSVKIFHKTDCDTECLGSGAVVFSQAEGSQNAESLGGVSISPFFYLYVGKIVPQQDIILSNWVLKPGGHLSPPRLIIDYEFRRGEFIHIKFKVADQIMEARCNIEIASGKLSINLPRCIEKIESVSIADAPNSKLST